MNNLFNRNKTFRPQRATATAPSATTCTSKLRPRWASTYRTITLVVEVVVAFFKVCNLLDVVL